MKFKRFEDIIAWQKSQELAIQIYDKFCLLNDLAFKDQIKRAVISISNNIAEGFDRETDKEFIRFLYYAKSSCSEVKSMLYLANKFDYIEMKEAELLRSSCDEVSRVIRGLIKYLSRS